MRGPRYVCILLLWLLATATGWAQPARLAPLQLSRDVGELRLDGHAQYWVDLDHLKTADQMETSAATLPWRIRQPGLQHRLDSAALWVRFEARVADAGNWYVTVGSSGIDRVQLFYRDASGAWVEQEAGDTRPVSQWPVPGRIPTFELAGATPQPVTYWLRVEHERVDFGAELRLVDAEHLLASRDREQFLLGAYFGVALLLALVGLANAAFYRDRNFTAYAVYLVTFTLGQVAYLGIGAQHLWDRWLEWNASSTFLLPGLSAAAALWFVQVVTEPARFSRLLNLAVWGLILALLVAVILDTWLPSRAIFLTRLALTSTALVLVGVLIGLVWKKGDDPEIRIIALGFVPVLVMALFPIARGFGLTPNNLFTRYGLAIGAALEMPILFYALNLRGNRRRQQHLRASALPRSDPLTGLADRRSLLQKIEDSLGRARSQRHACALLVVKLANYDTILGDYGRDTLERALVVAGSQLRRCATDIDLAARVGDREFALLLEGPTTPDAATGRAQQLVASGLRQAQALPQDLTLRLLVVVAMLPDQHPDAASSLQWAMDSMASFPLDARKQIRPLNF